MPVIDLGGGAQRNLMPRILQAIERLLRLGFRANDARRIQERRRHLTEAFVSVPSIHAQALYDRLSVRRRNDVLSELFHYRLATATRNSLLNILRGKIPARTSGTSPPACQYSISDAYNIELSAARQTLNKSRNVALDLYFGGTYLFYFAKLYEIITENEIAAAERGQFRVPAFLLHFVGIFYDLYYEAYLNHKNGDISRLPNWWSNHFTLANYPQHFPLDLWLLGVRNSSVSGVRAHITGDMAEALVRTYHSFKSKYCLQTLRFDDMYGDFFDQNRPLFGNVKRRFMDAMVRSRPFPVPGARIRSLLEMGDRIVGAGLNVTEIYNWRDLAWRTARARIGN